MRLMGSVPVGRIVYTRQALPAVEMVNFALVDGDIVFRTSAEGKLAAATRGAVVAFEADSVDPAEHSGWCVTIVGQARAVTDGAEMRRLERAAPPSWVTRQSSHFVRISPAMVNGRRVIGQSFGEARRVVCHSGVAEPRRGGPVARRAFAGAHRVILFQQCVVIAIFGELHRRA